MQAVWDALPGPVKADSVATAEVFFRIRSCVAESSKVVRTWVLPRRKAAVITAQMAEW